MMNPLKFLPVLYLNKKNVFLNKNNVFYVKRAKNVIY